MNRRWLPYIDYLILIALAGACYLLFFHHLGDLGLIGPDEPRYAAVAHEMLDSGDYITPRLNGEPWFEKPILMYWCTAIAYKLAGVNEWGARLPSALAATLSVFLVYWCGRRLWNRTIGLIAGLITASSVGFIAFSRAASMDMILTCCMTAGLVFFLVGLTDNTPSRRFYFYAFYAALGLGALAKGPVAFLLPGICLMVFIAIRGAWNEWRTWHPEGLLIALLIALPWYLLCTWANGFEFIRVFIINHNVERFASTIHGHQHPVYFYFPVLLLLTFPWTFLLIPVFRRHFVRTEQFMMLWVVVPFIFFSLSGSKLPGYILGVVPPIALLCARELAESRSRTFKVAVFIEAGAMAFVGVGFGFYNSMINVDPHVSGTLIATVAFSLGAALLIIAMWLNPRFLVAFNLLAMGAIVIVATNLIFPRFNRTDTMRPWKEALEQIVPPSEVVVLYRPARWMEYGLQFYRSGNARSAGSAEELAQMLAPKERTLCIAEDNSFDDLAKLGNIDMKVVHTIGKQSALWIWRTN